MADRNALRLAATLVVIGALFYEVVNLFHVGGANNDAAAFRALGNSSIWTAVHVGQFFGSALITAGVLALSSALNLAGGMPMLVNRIGAAALVASLALSGVVYAVDGVALKQAADAWLRAPAAEKTARFAGAETIRWLEWGVRSYSNYTFGLGLVLVAIAIVWTARISRPIGYLIGLNGLANFALGWTTGSEGFSSTTGIAFNVVAFSLAAWMIWLLIVAWRMKETAPAASPAASR